jgi:hypothetical protein
MARFGRLPRPASRAGAGASTPDLAQRPAQPRLLLVVERVVKLLQHRAHAHYCKYRRSSRSVTAANRRMGSSGRSPGQEAAISCAIAADLSRIASRPARCPALGGAARAIARMIQSAVPAAGSAHVGALRSVAACPRPSAASAVICAGCGSPCRSRCRCSSLNEA